MFKNESLSFCQQQMQQNPKGILICTKKTFKCYFCQGLLSQTEGQ